MASRRRKPRVEPHGVAAPGGCRSTLPPSARASEDPAPASGSLLGPPAPEEPDLGCRRNVLMERERRKRIAVSCERLRALLPGFDCRREDMASVLEMAVQFLRLAHTLVPAQGQRPCWDHSLRGAGVSRGAPCADGQLPCGQHRSLPSSLEPHVLTSCREASSLRWQEQALQVRLGSQAPAGRLNSGTGAPSLARPQDPPPGAPLGVDVSVAPSRLAKVLGGLPAPPGQQMPCEQGGGFPSAVRDLADTSISRTLSGRAPELQHPQWPPGLQQPASPAMSLEAQGWPGLAGGSDAAVLSALDARSAPGPDVEEGTALLLAVSPDWWLGSLEGSGGSAPAHLDRAGSLADTGPGFQELQHSLLEQWGPDLGCAGLAVREEPDSLFPDLFTGHL